MRFFAAAALAAALAACGGDDGDPLAAGNSRLSPAQVDAALGPADQSAVEDAVPEEPELDAIGNLGNDFAPAGNSAAAEQEDEQ